LPVAVLMLNPRLMANQDVHFYLSPLPNETPECVVKLVQGWTENNKEPERTVYLLFLPHLAPDPN
jgi:hypothetical protein